jgi:hypothetical protein
VCLTGTRTLAATIRRGGGRPFSVFCARALRRCAGAARPLEGIRADAFGGTRELRAPAGCGSGRTTVSASRSRAENPGRPSAESVERRLPLWSRCTTRASGARTLGFSYQYRGGLSGAKSDGRSFMRPITFEQPRPRGVGAPHLLGYRTHVLYCLSIKDRCSLGHVRECGSPLVRFGNPSGSGVNTPRQPPANSHGCADVRASMPLRRSGGAYGRPCPPAKEAGEDSRTVLFASFATGQHCLLNPISA